MYEYVLYWALQGLFHPEIPSIQPGRSADSAAAKQHNDKMRSKEQTSGFRAQSTQPLGRSAKDRPDQSLISLAAGTWTCLQTSAHKPSNGATYKPSYAHDWQASCHLVLTCRLFPLHSASRTTQTAQHNNPLLVCVDNGGFPNPSHLPIFRARGDPARTKGAMTHILGVFKNRSRPTVRTGAIAFWILGRFFILLLFRGDIHVG